jgi:hypothetical protein
MVCDSATQKLVGAKQINLVFVVEFGVLAPTKPEERFHINSNPKSPTPNSKHFELFFSC